MTAAASPPAAPENPPRDIPGLTSLRMFAAWLVFVHHYAPSTAGLWGPVTRQGHAGVTVFFVLSGFLITVRYYRPWVEGRLRLRDYVTKRVARILPLYYVVLALSLLLLGQGLATSGPRLPEWTMTQGFFWESLYHAAVPTSWSLTVEECFYILAPLVFRSLSALGGLRRPRVCLLALAAGTAAFWWIGLGLVDLAASRDLVKWYGFFAGLRHMAIYTIFGRFADFAAGIACGLFYLRGGAEAMWTRRGSASLSGALAAGSAVTLVLSLVLMDQAGGIFGSGFLAGWKYNLGVIVASAAMILSLTCPVGWPARAFAFAPFVYLGKISYALYLVQLTPLGQGALFGAQFSPTALHATVLYLAMNVVSAILYEGVEKPARRLVLRFADPIGAGVERLLRSTPTRWNPSRLASGFVLGIVVTTLVVALGNAAVSLGLNRGGPITLVEARAAAGGADSPIVATMEADAESGLRRVRLPEGWQRGGQADSAVLLFVDETPLPIRLGEPEAQTRAPYAFSRGPKSGSVFVRCREDASCASAFVWRPTPEMLRTAGARRALKSPLVILGFGSILIVWIGIAVRAAGRRPASNSSGPPDQRRRPPAARS